MGAFRSDPSILQILSELNDKILKADTDQTYVYSPLERKLADGDVAVVNAIATGVASGGTANVALINPSTSSKTAYIAIVVIDTTDQAHVKFIADASVDTASATALTPFMPMLGQTVSMEMKGYQGVTYTGGTTLMQRVIPGGSGRFAVGSSTIGLVAIGIPPGHNGVIEVTNTSANSNDISFTVLWWEE